MLFDVDSMNWYGIYLKPGEIEYSEAEKTKIESYGN
jgi:hypothetical protein